jgi:hypothetical protein
MRTADLASMIHAVGVDCDHGYFRSPMLSFLNTANPSGEHATPS